MNLLTNLKVSQKLIVLICTLSAAILLVAGLGYIFINQSNEALEKMYGQKLKAIELINDSRAHIRKVEADTYALMLPGNEARDKMLFDDINKRTKVFDANMEAFEKLPLTETEKTKLQAVKNSLADYRAERSKVLELVRADKDAEAQALFSQKAEGLVNRFTEDLYDLSNIVRESAEKMHDETQAAAMYAKTLFAVISGIALLLSVLMGWLIIRQISSRMEDIVEYLGVLSGGDFSRQVSQSSLEDQSEFGSVSRAVEEMKNNIKNLVRHLTDTSHQLVASSEELTANAEQSAQASNQIAETVAQVAQGAEKQLQLADHSSEAVQQIATVMDQVAGNTEVVAASAEKTAEMANLGEDAIKKAVSQMQTIAEKTKETSEVIGELEEKSKEIGQIVDVIASIAGQTNLLALNAAIEAARAGEAGRGFAVVAEEVRKLAEQSQDAAKRITDLINEVQSRTNNAVNFMNEGKKEVDAGSEVVSGAGQSFDQILTMVRTMAKEVHEISAALEEISSGSQKVVFSVQEIDRESKGTSEKTQTISAAAEEQSASVEEIASASEHLAQMAEGLQKEVQKFRI